MLLHLLSAELMSTYGINRLVVMTRLSMTTG